MRSIGAKPKEAFFHQIDIWKWSHIFSVKPSEGCGLLCNRTQNKTSNKGDGEMPLVHLRGVGVPAIHPWGLPAQWERHLCR